MLEIDLVRHGESLFNRMGIVQGHTDSPLTDLGREQANRAGEVLRERGIRAIYTSDLARAWETACIVGEEIGVKPVVMEGFREIRLGKWEGRPIEEIREKDSKNLELWYSCPLEARIPGAESLEEFQKRVLNTLEEIKRKDGDGRIAIVSHGGVLSVIISCVLGLDINHLWHFRLSNASLSRVVFGYLVSRLVLLNDTCHMNGLKSTSP
jgi:broad specificity phosphatase PhoE